MRVITPSADDVVSTPAAEVTGLASPSRGSTELSTWKVAMRSDSTGPEHVIDREQVWTVTAGAVEIVSEGRTERVEAGQTVVLPAGAVRTVRTGDRAAEAMVAMAAGGLAFIPGEEAGRPVPWAR
jgi:quercetin dioxygenase-like cupin family protein